VKAALLVLLLWATPARAELIPLPAHGRISVRYEPGLESAARDVDAAAEDALADIASDLVDLPVPEHITIQLVHDAADLARVAPGGRGAPSYAVGVAYPDLGVLSVAMRKDGHDADPIQTLRHELGHLALGAALGDHAPRWLHEGFANQHARAWSWNTSETLAGMAWFGGIVPYDELVRGFPSEELPASHAYVEAYDFTGFLTRRGRYEDPDDDGDRWPFRRFLANLAHGQTVDQAARDAYGKPMHDLFDEWKDEVGKRYLWAPVGVLGLGIWVLCALLLAIAYWRRRRNNKRRLAQWERDEVVAPPYVPWPGEDPLADPEDEKDKPRDPQLMN
jgi:hypothetical protein